MSFAIFAIFYVKSQPADNSPAMQNLKCFHEFLPVLNFHNFSREIAMDSNAKPWKSLKVEVIN